jgi:GAF domain-containing protein
VGRDPPDQAARQLVEEQAALRRVATLVARGEPPEAVFTAVLEEAGRLLPVDLANMCRYEPNRTGSFVATWGTAGERFPVGFSKGCEWNFPHLYAEDVGDRGGARTGGSG